MTTRDHFRGASKMVLLPNAAREGPAAWGTPKLFAHVQAKELLLRMCISVLPGRHSYVKLCL